MGNASPLYEYQSSGLFKQNQLTTNINARLSARYALFVCRPLLFFSLWPRPRP